MKQLSIVKQTAGVLLSLKVKDEWIRKSTHPHTNLLLHDIYCIHKTITDIDMP